MHAAAATVQLDMLEPAAQTRVMLLVRPAFRNLGRGVF
jgi:hypothetical protein